MDEQFENLMKTRDSKHPLTNALYTLLFDCLDEKSFGVDAKTKKAYSEVEMKLILEDIELKSVGVFLPVREQVNDANACEILVDHYY